MFLLLVSWKMALKSGLDPSQSSTVKGLYQAESRSNGKVFGAQSISGVGMI